MAGNCIKCDVAIVGSGFAGAIIANELSQKGISVVILEAGAGVPPNINGYMSRFYKADAKVPESAYPPDFVDSKGNMINPKDVAAGRPTVLSLLPDRWKKPDQSYLVQKGPAPFPSTYERVAGGTAHWLGTSLRLVPGDFRSKSNYGKNQKDFPLPDWPNAISAEKLSPYYARAEAELGVSADVKEQSFLGVSFSKDYSYPMPRIPPSLLDQRIGAALTQLTDDDTRFLGMGKPVNEIKVRSLPAARNSQPYRNRRACAGNTNCIPICPIQAKYDPTITLNEATNRGAQLIDHAVASEIVVEDGPVGRVSQINFIKYEKEAGPRTGEGCVKAKVYVIAANAIETPRLLLMSNNKGRTEKGVSNRSGQVGCNLMDHPYYVAWGLLPMTAKPVFPYRGPLITSGIGDLCDGPFRARRAAFRVDIGNEGWNYVIAGGAFGADPLVTTVDFVNGMNSSGLNQRQFTQLPQNNDALFGAGLAQKLNDLMTRQFRIGFLVEQTPEARNKVTVSKTVFDGLKLPRPEVSYDISHYTKQGIVAAYRMKELMFRKLGAQDFTETAAGDPAAFDEMIDGEKVTLTYGGAGHIMGTYRMGDDWQTSVVDSFQRSHDHNNLYLVGSGTFPTGGTANPTLTISALAMRTADSIAGDLKTQG
ncbi:GMC family oxidoreductase [Bradyrhizobium jicamae]|uniref:GMC family oxidoreductase n=1 Tax=Bradyrhizobium jicamae TaxID=280332 RepID=A0ABS5FKP9_9BRAD|nr:GMC family oxidoreductase [Bradyrhizobium jicamae]MBR0797372.1 GMC family oxidoreductase [Bradyrhizobium jicamae]